MIFVLKHSAYVRIAADHRCGAGLRWNKSSIIKLCFTVQGDLLEG